MIVEDYIISPAHIHGRVASRLCHELGRLKCYDRIYLSTQGRRVKGSSLLGILSLGVIEGEEIYIAIATGTKAEMEEVKKVFTSLSE